MERFVCQGHWGSLPRPDLEVDQSAMKLVGYWTSHKEIRDIYQCLPIEKTPRSPTLQATAEREAIHDILSSLRSWLHRWMYSITAEEDTQGPVDEPQSRPRRGGDSHEEGLWEARMAHQRVLEAVQVLKGDIERLSWGMRDVQ